MEKRKKNSLFIFVVFLIGIIVISGFLYQKYEAGEIKKEKYLELSAISKLKESQISGWISKQLLNAEFVARSPFYVEVIDQLMKGKANASLIEKIIELNTLVKEQNNLEDVILISPDFKKTFSISEKKFKLDPTTQEKLLYAKNSKSTTLTPIFFCPTHNQNHLDFISPVIHENKLIAFFICRTNTATFLNPLIQSWPTNSKTGETLLVTVEHDSVVFLNQLRHVKNIPLKMKISLKNKDIAAVRAALGENGIFEGNDYSGVKVLSDIIKVRNTNWFMIAKVDIDELYANLSYRTIMIYVIVLLVSLLIVIFFVANIRSNQKDHLEKLLAFEKERRKEEQEFRTTLYSIGDGVITTDLDGKIKRMNHVAEELTGWKEKDARGADIEKVFEIISEETRKHVETPIRKVLDNGIVVGLANHTLLVSRDGSETPIADSGSPIRDEIGEISGVVLVFRDQTEERNKQKEIEESAHRFLSLFQNMSEGVALHELVFNQAGKPVNYRIIDINHQFENILNLKKENIVGKLATEAYGVEVPPYLNEYSSVAITEKPKLIKTYFPPMDKHFEISVAPWSNNGFATIFTDVTERIKNEEAILLREEKLSVTLNSIGDGVISTDINGMITNLNPVAEKLTGWTNEEAVGVPLQKVFNIINSETRETAANPIWRVIKEGVIVGLANHTALISKDGAERQIADSAAPIKMKDGKIIGAVLVFSDVTDQYAIQDRLKQSERLLRESQKVARIGSYFLDMNAGFWQSSDTLNEIFGIDENYEKSVAGWIAFIHPEWQDFMNDYLFNDVLKNGRFDQEYKIVRLKDGVERWVHGYGEVEFDENKNPINMIGTIQDVTDITNARVELEKYKNKLEEIVRQRTEQLDNVNARLIEEIQKQKEYELLLQHSLINEKEMNELKGRFISTVSHEFRTPLMSIQLSIDLLQRYLKEIPDQRLSHQINSIQQSIVNLTKLLDDVLTINRADAGKINYEPAKLNLKDTIESVIEEESVYKKENHEVVINYKTERTEFSLDKKLLRYILMNLLSNAFKYSPDGGKIELTVSLLGGYLNFIVKDCGIGFGEDVSDKLFEPFFRAKNAIDIPGSGLGLSIVKKAVELHKGEIQYTSEQGKGTQFSVKIPV